MTCDNSLYRIIYWISGYACLTASSKYRFASQTSLAFSFFINSLNLKICSIEWIFPKQQSYHALFLAMYDQTFPEVFCHSHIHIPSLIGQVLLSPVFNVPPNANNWRCMWASFASCFEGYLFPSVLSFSLLAKLSFAYVQIFRPYHHYDSKNFVRFNPASLRHPIGWMLKRITSPSIAMTFSNYATTAL